MPVSQLNIQILWNNEADKETQQKKHKNDAVFSFGVWEELKKENIKIPIHPCILK